MIRLVVAAAAAASLCGCVAGPRYSRETDWPGSGYGRVESRTDIGRVSATEGPIVTAVPAGRGFVPLEVGPLFYTPPLSHHEIRSSEGTLHIISSERAFPEGSCVAWSGYADAPDRKYWSWGRVELEASSKCPP